MSFAYWFILHFFSVVICCIFWFHRFLSRNQLSWLPPNVFQFTVFTMLDLSYNMFKYPPPALGSTSQIATLYVCLYELGLFTVTEDWNHVRVMIRPVHEIMHSCTQCIIMKVKIKIFLFCADLVAHTVIFVSVKVLSICIPSLSLAQTNVCTQARFLPMCY